MATDTKPRTPAKSPSVGVSRTAGRPVSSPRHTRPYPATKPQRVERPGRTDRELARRKTQQTPRMPFILLLVGLLGGAIVSLLVISTTLDQGAYRITSLTNQNAMLNKEIQVVSNDVANEQNPATIMGEAYKLGMRYDKDLRFVDTKNGKVSSSNPVTP